MSAIKEYYHDEIEEDMRTIPAIPPDDYSGTIADWTVALVERGLWDEVNPEWYGDIIISTDDWWEILEQCEQ